MEMKSVLILVSAAVLSIFASCQLNVQQQGTNYYLDAEKGDDNNRGTSPEAPWKTLERLYTVDLQAGDSVLLKKGGLFRGVLDISGQGEPGKRIVVDAYGEGKKPCISGLDTSLYAVRVYNSSYVTVQNLEVVNTGKEPLPYRTGVKVQSENYGLSRHILLHALDIRDVNGSKVKQLGGGSGILIENRWDHTVSTFDSLTIEHCTIRRCERNAMIWNSLWSRKDWHPATNTVVRYNLIEEVPGDGIVPIGCDGALIEYNVMRNCPPTLPDTEAAAGIWPWSCDNTLIQFNESSGHKAPWDAQGFDSDYNCRNTTIQYNYSHDNEGGFLLICDAGGTDTTRNIGNRGSLIRYNISINDAVRTRLTREGYFSPTIHIAGHCTDTRIYNNILHVNRKPEQHVDRSIITSNSWNGFAERTTFKSNIFYTREPSAFRMTKSTDNLFDGNYYLGDFVDKPVDQTGRTQLDAYVRLLSGDPTGFEGLNTLMETKKIADGAAEITTVNKDAIERFFEQINK
jgi:hypothetical protein